MPDAGGRTSEAGGRRAEVGGNYSRVSFGNRAMFPCLVFIIISLFNRRPAFVGLRRGEWTRRRDTGLESPVNPQTGKSALRRPHVRLFVFMTAI